MKLTSILDESKCSTAIIAWQFSVWFYSWLPRTRRPGKNARTALTASSGVASSPLKIPTRSTSPVATTEDASASHPIETNLKLLQVQMSVFSSVPRLIAESLASEADVAAATNSSNYCCKVRFRFLETPKENNRSEWKQNTDFKQSLN